MTHVLDALNVGGRLSAHDTTRAIEKPATAAAAKVTVFGTFAITFGIAFAVIYTILERFNWPLVTYFPSLNELDFWKATPRPGAGPPMYWYGWLLNSLIASLVVGGIATMVPAQWLRRVSVFCCALATLWVAFHVLASLVNSLFYLDSDALDSYWLPAIPAFLGPAFVTTRLSNPALDRAWRDSLLAMPIAGLIVLGYSLQQFFTH
jgi:hypothetical protein